MSSQFIINVTESNFEFEVVNFSHNVPVVVDFWAEWCVPCKMLDPILQKIAKDYDGRFRLAKVNVDENQKLAMRFNVSGIPSIKAFREGKVISEFTGVQPESQIIKFLQDIIPTFLDLNLEKANSMLASGSYEQACNLFRQVIDEQPGHSNALLGLSKSLVALGRSKEARDILNNFPISREYPSAKKLKFLTMVVINLKVINPDTGNRLDQTYYHALRLIGLGNLQAAMDGILDILRLDKSYRQGEAKQVILGIFEILGVDSPITREYQAELASIIY